MELALGTAQFGSAYGVSNRRGALDEEEAIDILAAAVAAGIRTVDTAPAYGDGRAERIIGKFVARSGSVAVVTKTAGRRGPSGRSGTDPVSDLKRSLERMQIDAVDGLLLHDIRDLDGEDGPRIARGLIEARDRGLARRIGVSVYTGKDIDRASNLMPIGLVQAPVSIVDRRLVASGHLARLRDQGAHVHGRSAFLQGLLTIAPDRVPAGFEPCAPSLSRLHDACARSGMTVLEACLGAVAATGLVGHCVVGVTSLGELREVADAFVRASGRLAAGAWPGTLAGAVAGFPGAFLNPAAWPERPSG